MCTSLVHVMLLLQFLERHMLCLTLSLTALIQSPPQQEKSLDTLLQAMCIARTILIVLRLQGAIFPGCGGCVVGKVALGAPA